MSKAKVDQKYFKDSDDDGEDEPNHMLDEDEMTPKTTENK
jgi:hypothetical protein